MALKKNKETKRLIALLALSILIHILGFILFWWLKPEFKHIEKKSFMVQLQASQLVTEITETIPEETQTQEPPPEPKKEEAKKDDPAPEPDPATLPNSYRKEAAEGSINQADKEAGSIKEGERAKTKKSEQKKAKEVAVKEVVKVEPDRSDKPKVSEEKSDSDALEDALIGVYGDLDEYDESIDSLGESDEGVESEIEVETLDDEWKKKDVDVVGNTTLLADSELSETFVEDPFSVEKSREFNIINSYLKAIWDAVMEGWTNPLSEGQIKQGPVVEIVFELSSEGSIREPTVRMQSKFPKLDESLIQRLEELKNHKFDMHESYLDKYRYFTLRWSGSKVAYELMPFEEGVSNPSKETK